MPTPDDTTAVGRATRWLAAYLVGRGGQAPVREVTAAALVAGHRWRTVRRAAAELHVESTRTVFGGAATWTLAGQRPDQRPGRRPAPDIAAASEPEPVAAPTPTTTRRVMSRPARYGEPAEFTQVAGSVERSHWSASAWRGMDEL